jgi:broad specificity phosphatase PhoE
MKWPNTLTVVRHGESEYNILKRLKEQDPLYQEFKSAYSRRQKDPKTVRKLAKTLLAKDGLVIGVGDFETQLTAKGLEQAKKTAIELKKRIPLPDVVLVSPYERTKQTLGQMALGWTALNGVKLVEDERLREQEHGLSLIYNDWRIFNVMQPDQDRLRGIEGPYWYRYPQGENVPDVRERLRSMVGAITRDYQEKNVLVVTHHLSILALRANLERLDAAGFTDLDDNQKPVNCGVTIYRGDPTQGQDGHLVLDVYNQQLY